MFLAGINFAARVQAVGQFLILGQDFRDIRGDQVLVLHGEHRQLQTDHAPDLPRPEPARVDHHVRFDAALFGDHLPAAVRRRMQRRDPVMADYLGAADTGRFGVGVGDPGRVDMALVGVPQGADKELFLDQRVARLGLRRADQLAFQTHITGLGLCGLQKIEPVPVFRHDEPAGRVYAAGLLGDCFDLLIQTDGVVLQPGDIGVAVQGMHAAGGVPGGAGGQLLSLHQDNVLPAKLAEVIQHTATDHAAADDDYLGMGPH